MAGNSWLEVIARFGYAAVGVLYLLIGLFALKLAIGTESRASDAQRVIVRIGGQAYGKLLLGIIAGGLLATLIIIANRLGGWQAGLFITPFLYLAYQYYREYMRRRGVLVGS